MCRLCRPRRRRRVRQRRRWLGDQGEAYQRRGRLGGRGLWWLRCSVRASPVSTFLLPCFTNLSQNIGIETYLNSQISMHEHHKLPRVAPLIPNEHTRPQTILTQCNRINQAEVTIPSSLRLLTQVLWAKTKVKFYRVVNATLTLRLGRRLAEEFPARGAREAVLWEGVGSWVVFRLAKDLYTIDQPLSSSLTTPMVR